MYTLKGILKVKSDTVQVSDSFKKREFVVEDKSGQYAQTIQFQLAQDRCEQLDKFVTGQPVSVTFFLRGKEWTNPKDGQVKYFNTLDAWKIELDSIQGTDAEAKQSNGETFVAEGDDDLPF